jgi:hypothetical protein
LLWRSDIQRKQIVDIEIEYPKTQVRFALPDEHLAFATTEIRRNLELGINLATELIGFEGLPIPRSSAIRGACGPRAAAICWAQ